MASSTMYTSSAQTLSGTTIVEFPKATTVKYPRGALYNRPEMTSISIDAETSFKHLVTALVHEWTDLVDCLEYRQMHAYYIGLVDWRNGIYSPHNNAFPATPLHQLRQLLRARVLLPRGRDEDFYRLQCSAFRHEQRKRLAVLTQQLRLYERWFAGRVSRKFILTVRRVVELQGGLKIKDEFDYNHLSERETARRQAMADVKFGPMMK